MPYAIPGRQGTGNTGDIIDILTGMGAAYNVLADGADPAGLLDSTNAINRTDARAAIAGAGAAVLFPPGTYMVSGGLVKQSGPAWVPLGGPGSVIIKLAAGSNAPVLTSAGFAGLSMSGSVTAGLTACTIRDIIFDGNASGQSAPAAFGVGIYGYDFRFDAVVRNCLAADGLYTEWGLFGGAGLPEKAMEARITAPRIHDNILTGAAWHNRGPHDSQVWAPLIYNNTDNAFGYWGETTGGGYAATALSGTAVASTPATITVTTTLGLPAAGSVTVPSAGGTVTITYTGVTATTLTGCVAAGGGGNYSSNTLTAPGYAGSAALIQGAHIWGHHSIGMVMDCETHVSNSEIEGAVTGQLLVRSGNSTWDGGKIFYPTSGNGYGIQLGDATNKATAFSLNNPVLSGFTGGAAAQAAVNFVNTASGSYRATIFKANDNQQVYGTLQPYERRQFAWGGATVTPVVVAAAGAGGSPPAPTFSNGSDARGTVNMGTGTNPTAGDQATITFAQPKPGTPEIGIWAKNAATAALQPYVSNVSSTGFRISFGVAPAASQSVGPPGTYLVGYADVTG